MTFKVILILYISFSLVVNVHSKEKEDALPKSLEKQLKNFIDYKHQDGEAISLTPLEKRYCYGEKYREEQISNLLEVMYINNEIVSGFAQFLDFHEKSVAVKNKEFRFSFQWPRGAKKIELQYKKMLSNIATHSMSFSSLLEFKLRLYVLSPELQKAQKEIKSFLDFPAVYIQFVGNRLGDIETFKPYQEAYLDLLYKQSPQTKSLFIRNVKNSITPEKHNYQENRGFTKFSNTIITRGFDFSTSEYKLEKENSKVNISPFSFYGAFFANEKVSPEQINEMTTYFNTELTRMFFGIKRISTSLNIEITTPIESIFSNSGSKYEGVTNFEKTLFLAIYTRIKPLNMNKRKFIHSVMKVMQPCIS